RARIAVEMAEAAAAPEGDEPAVAPPAAAAHEQSRRTAARHRAQQVHAALRGPLARGPAAPGEGPLDVARHRLPGEGQGRIEAVEAGAVAHAAAAPVGIEPEAAPFRRIAVPRDEGV